MSAATSPARDIAALAGGAALLVLSPLIVGALVATNAGTIAGAVLGWVLVWWLARPPRARGWEVAR